MIFEQPLVKYQIEAQTNCTVRSMPGVAPLLWSDGKANSAAHGNNIVWLWSINTAQSPLMQCFLSRDPQLTDFRSRHAVIGQRKNLFDNSFYQFGDPNQSQPKNFHVNSVSHFQEQTECEQTKMYKEYVDKRDRCEGEIAKTRSSLNRLALQGRLWERFDVTTQI